MPDAWPAPPASGSPAAPSLREGPDSARTSSASLPSRKPITSGEVNSTWTTGRTEVSLARCAHSRMSVVFP